MNITLEQLHEDIVGLKREIRSLREIVAEDFELSDNVKKDILHSRSQGKLVSHEEMRKEFG
ncbi:hypothetical protein J4460_09060 [Candidatus Woesearchaeota archaeon]|nr:hypothetical protein [Candidatus Woesearchaeota archaeon]HIH37469.1 hypothetical protein [Candidatus Woesearchaeota archaeon]HIH49637.1 hypothetical protein [Candidatus Woesearchaeota archaeon]HIJ03115.1 hypothetical protein [Candidatus Woesearchaeota archaeon]